MIYFNLQTFCINKLQHCGPGFMSGWLSYAIGKGPKFASQTISFLSICDSVPVYAQV